jgi:hypothetical protein
MKPVDHMPDEWNWTLKKVFAHVTKIFGDDHSLALSDIKQALANGWVRAVVRPLTDNSKWRELPIEFWQTHKLSSVGPDHIIVLSDKYPAMGYRFFLRQSDVEKVWRVNDRVATAPNETSLPPWRKNSVGTKTEYDWEKILIEAARYMWEEGVPQSEAKLRSHIEKWCKGDAPGESQLKSHLAPLYRTLKRADGK